MLLDDIVTYLSSGGIGTPNQDLFAAFIPATAPDALTVVYETGGMPPVKTMAFGPNTSVVERPRIQVVCRAAPFEYEAARSKAHAVFKLLDGMPTRTSSDGTRYQWAAAVQSPAPMGRDDDNRPMVVCNYDIVKAVTA